MGCQNFSVGGVIAIDSRKSKIIYLYSDYTKKITIGHKSQRQQVLKISSGQLPSILYMCLCVHVQGLC